MGSNNLSRKAVFAHKDKRNARPLKYSQFVHTCKICGKPAVIGNLCQSCSDFIRQKRTEEGTGKK